MMNSDAVDRSNLISISGKEVDLGAPIFDTIKADGRIFVRLDLYNLPSDHPYKGRNIIALNEGGEELWRVEPHWWTVKSQDGRDVPSPYTQIWTEDDNKLFAFQPIGFICEIDPNTGKILKEEQTR